VPKVVHVILILLGLSLASTSLAHALTPEEKQIIQKAAVAFLDATPDNSYLLLPEEINKRILSGAKDFLLVDVRSNKEFKTGHLPGAINIPQQEIADPDSLALLPRDKEIILYCGSGHQSTKVLPILRMLGYKSYGMKWGMIGWDVGISTTEALKAIAVGTAQKYPVVR
jgi:rhodanese-related sulfurtransferase